MPWVQKYTAMTARPETNQDPHQPAIQRAPEPVEGHILVEERVPDAERRGIQSLQDSLLAID